MQTAWGDLPVADAHVHFFSHAFFSSLAAQKHLPAEGAVDAVGRTLGWQMPPLEPEHLAEIWVAQLDRHGVDRAALIASIHGDEDSVAAAVARFPQRFYGYFMLNPLAPDAATRVTKALGEQNLRGVCLFPAMHRFSIADECLAPLLDAASRHPGVVVFVHCGVLTVGVRRKLDLPSPFDMRFSNPIDLHPVALRYPKLHFVVPHFGAGYLREALMLCDLCPNVFLDTSSSNGWLRYQAPEIDLKAAFRRALDVAGSGRLLFGSDSSFFPRGWQAEIFHTQERSLYELGLSKADAGHIFAGNLDGLLSR